MTDRVISPPYNQLATLRTPLTLGERQVLDFFNKHLAPEWEIYIQPHLNGLRPDFVLLNPHVGIAVFEVKDWNLDAINYQFELRDFAPPALIAHDREGQHFRQRGNPVDKIAQYKQAILNLYCPRLQIRARQNPSFIALVTAGIIMTGTNTTHAENLFRPSLSYHKMLNQRSYYPVVGGDAIKSGDINRVFPSHSFHSRYMDSQLADDLRSWLIEPDFSIAQRQPLTLDAKQKDFATKSTPSGYRRIKGPAGSGKSLVLAARAAQLSAEGHDVLVVTFNKTLWHYLRDLAVRQPVPGRRLNEYVEWCHFHEWCKQVCEEAGFEDEYYALWDQQIGGDGDRSPDSLSEVLQNTLPALVDHALTVNGHQVTKYDALLVDEGQDFNLDWWNILRKVIRPGGEYMLVADETQDLYDQAKHWTDDKMVGAGFPNGSWAHLTASYRLPPKLVPLLRNFVATHLSKYINNPPETEQLALALYPAQLRWIQVLPIHAAEICIEEIDNLHTIATNLLAFPDITFLTESHEFGLHCVKLLNDKGIHYAHVFGRTSREKDNNKHAFYMGDARMKASTIHSFKGWETRAIVVHLGAAHDHRALATAYVALSRLKRQEQESLLTVVCSAPELEEYGRTWPIFERR